MTNKLNAGDNFPDLSLTSVDEKQLTIPALRDPGSYQIVLFFRGKF